MPSLPAPTAAALAACREGGVSTRGVLVRAWNFGSKLADDGAANSHDPDDTLEVVLPDHAEEVGGLSGTNKEAEEETSEQKSSPLSLRVDASHAGLRNVLADAITRAVVAGDEVQELLLPDNGIDWRGASLLAESLGGRLWTKLKLVLCL